MGRFSSKENLYLKGMTSNVTLDCYAISWAGCDENKLSLGRGIDSVRNKQNGSLLAGRKLLLIKED